MLVQLSPEDIARLAQIIREETGNLVQEKNHSMIESRMRTHVMKLGLGSMAEYWKHFADNEKQERDSLQSLMTTHYTFFFREYAHFEVFGRWLDENSVRLKEQFSKNKTPLRVWSAACSRGQEVYSLIMFLEENLLKKYGVDFEVTGTDIDNESVAYAKNGVYPLKEVNTIPHEFVSGYWKKGSGAVKDFAAIHPALKAKAKFDSANLLEINKWNPSAKFDIVFCRNVFIYFSEDNVKKIALDLVERLNVGGLLISGLSEPLRFQEFKLKALSPSVYYKDLGAKAAVEAPKAPVTAPKPAVPKTVTPASTPIAAEPVASQPATSASEKYFVLCVDDSPTIQIIIKKIFSQDPSCAGVDIASNGREAREKLDAKRYHIMTLDIHMPEVNGIEFLEKYYNRKIDPPVLMVSSVNRTDLDLATKSLKLGAFDYVEKPAMNNLAKSSNEILTKGAMARRAKKAEGEPSTGGFDESIGQKIVVPDASQCLRVVYSSIESKSLLEQIVKAQKNEYRSPALLIIHRDENGGMNIENEMLKWTDRPVTPMREVASFLRPNQIYVAKPADAPDVCKNLKLKTVSLQILDSQVAPDASLFARAPVLQLLIDEKITEAAPLIERRIGAKLSDITPATSFASLSLEFFANLRKAA